MNSNNRAARNVQLPDSGGGAAVSSSPGPRLCVLVIATTDEGTIAALQAARRFSSNLGARITVLKIEAVPPSLPLHRPPVSLDFIIEHQRSLVLQAGVMEMGVAIEVRLCRDREGCLQGVLRRRALIVIGGKRRWWLSQEEKLERALRRLGHHLIFIDVGRMTARTFYSRFLLSLGTGTPNSHKQAEALELSFEYEKYH